MSNMANLQIGTLAYDIEYLKRLCEVKKQGYMYLKHSSKATKAKYKGSVPLLSRHKISLNREIVRVKERIEANNYDY